jgi:hypothetical protein
MLIPVYQAEIDAGVADRVRASAAYAYAVPLTGQPAEVSEKALARLKSLRPEWTVASEGDFDLHPLKTVLVSVGWNLNDDVFDPLEVWTARHTPAHKPLNFEHDCARIVGHMTDDWVVDADGNVLPEAVAADKLPAKFHVVTAAVLYKSWSKPDLQEVMDRTLAEIEKGEWFVSMECLFKGFDYAVQGTDGSTRTVARSAETAYLTKHLRVYGGTGRYGEYRVGRLLRNVHFSGKGLVRKPANPESIILQEQVRPFAGAAMSAEEFGRIFQSAVYEPTSTSPGRREQESKAMQVEATELQKRLDQALAEVERLKASQQEKAVTELKDKLAKAEAAAKQAADDVAALKAGAEKAKADAEAAVAAVKAELAAAQAKLADAGKTIQEKSDELQGLYAAKTKAERLAAVKDKLKFDDEAADAFLATVAGLSKDQFDKQIDILSKAVSVAQKATQAPPAPKATDAPTHGKAGAEADEAGEEAAAGTEVKADETGKTGAAVSTTEATDGVKNINKAVAAFFGCDDEEAAK